MDRIEKSAFRKGEYVGYSGMDVWRIYGGTGAWNAYSRDTAGYLRARTLRELNRKLSVIDYTSRTTLTGSL